MISIAHQEVGGRDLEVPLLHFKVVRNYSKQNEDEDKGKYFVRFWLLRVFCQTDIQRGVEHSLPHSSLLVHGHHFKHIIIIRYFREHIYL